MKFARHAALSFGLSTWAAATSAHPGHLHESAAQAFSMRHGEPFGDGLAVAALALGYAIVVVAAGLVLRQRLSRRRDV